VSQTTIRVNVPNYLTTDGTTIQAILGVLAELIIDNTAKPRDVDCEVSMAAGKLKLSIVHAKPAAEDAGEPKPETPPKANDPDRLWRASAFEIGTSGVIVMNGVLRAQESDRRGTAVVLPEDVWRELVARADRDTATKTRP
jgi:hypothetical protein